MRVLLALILGAAIGAAAVWLYKENRAPARLQTAGAQIASAAHSAQHTLESKLSEFHLTSEDIKHDLARTGQVIREKAEQAGQAVSNATADARITTTIKAKLVADPDLSAWHISVNTTDGVVTLSGTVSSAKDIGKAVLLAMQTHGVHKVISTLQVKSK